MWLADCAIIKAASNNITNCVIFGCTITTIDFGAGTNNAASAYIDDMVLGTETIRWLNLPVLGYGGGYASLNDTPAADFGDFRPQAGSVLIGAGVAVSGITDDIEGNLRPDPPTIGAYGGVAIDETPVESSPGLLFATGSNGAGQLGLGDSGEGTNRSAFSLVGDRVWSAIDRRVLVFDWRVQWRALRMGR